MKKLLLVCLAVGLVLSFGSIALAGPTPGSGIVGTFHDLRLGQPGATSGDNLDQTNLNRLCVYCHAPHNTNKPDGNNFKYMPLWNHDAPLTLTNGGWTLYSNGTEKPGSTQHQSQAMTLLTGVRIPGGVSMLCLSCHDGSTATNAYGYSQATAPAKGSAPFKYMGQAGGGGLRALIGGGGDLSNHHPIGFTYAQVALSDDEIRFDTHSWTNGVADYPALNGPSSIADLLWNGQMECVTCHDVHNTKNGGSKFTWIEDRNSQLCLTCHNKDNTGQN